MTWQYEEIDAWKIDCNKWLTILNEIEKCNYKNECKWRNVLAITYKKNGCYLVFYIFLQGMTNRKDMIDEALYRPGRLEVQMEIGQYF